jgi:glycosyltransferase involved in cell wall biosynthesis
MIVSFIVPSYNSEKTIENNIKSIVSQKCKKEIIVVDGGSIDKTISILKKYKLKIFLEKKRGAGPARNLGMNKSKGDYIAFVDSDVVLPDNWIEKCIKKINQNKSIAGVGGPGISIDKSIVSKCLNGLLYGKSKKSKDTYVNSLATMDVLYRKSHIRGMLFDNKMIMGEDPEFNFRLVKNGYKLLFSRSLFVYHNHPTKLIALVKKWYEYGNYYMKPYIKHKEMIEKEFYFRVFYIPLLLLMGILSFINQIFIYLVVIQLLSLFLSYLFIGIVNLRDKTLIAFPFIHTIKQLSQMVGIFVSVLRGIINGKYVRNNRFQFRGFQTDKKDDGPAKA